MHWRYKDIRPQLLRAGELTPIEKAERRVLVLENPGERPGRGVGGQVGRGRVGVHQGSALDLPFSDDTFDVVWMQNVGMNIADKRKLYGEIYRVLKTSGQVILTTPAAWSDGLLKIMARTNLVSAEEIHEHAFAYTLPLLGWYCGRAGFEMTKLKFGYFEFMLNMWAVAKK